MKVAEACWIMSVVTGFRDKRRTWVGFVRREWDTEDKDEKEKGKKKQPEEGERCQSDLAAPLLSFELIMRDVVGACD
jgi:hypothetical protein